MSQELIWITRDYKFQASLKTILQRNVLFAMSCSFIFLMLSFTSYFISFSIGFYLSDSFCPFPKKGMYVCMCMFGHNTGNFDLL
jgi:hypothetical protein